MDAPKEFEVPAGWAKFDPAAMKRQAEGKEAKIARKESLRKMRSEARKEKRHLKSAAKQARKANVQRAAKWTPERIALDKAKKLETKPLKKARREGRLLLRAEKLEAQARKLWYDAQKSRAQWTVVQERKLKEKREEEERVENLEGQGDFIPVVEDDTIEDFAKEEARGEALVDPNQGFLDFVNGRQGKAITNGHGDSKSTSSESSDEANDEAAPTPPSNGDIDMFADARESPEPAAAAATEPEADSDNIKEKSVTEEVPAVPEAKTEQENGDGSKKKKKKSKKEKLPSEPIGEAAGSAEVAALEGAEKPKKEKKRKRDALADGHDETVDDASRKEKRKKSKRKEEAEAAASVGDDASTAKKIKKQKRSKKEKQAELEKYDEEAPPAVPAAEADASEQWNVNALDGGADRQDKFLRLLGGKKSKDPCSTETGPTASTAAKPRDKLDMGHVASDLEKQFDAGVRMKFELNGQKRGLGA